MAYLDGYTGQLVTTEWILIELADALSAPSARSTAAAILQAVRQDQQFEVVGYSESAYQAEFILYAQRPDKSWSLTDCISFGVMTDRKLTIALTADQHFVQAGFRAMFK